MKTECGENIFPVGSIRMYFLLFIDTDISGPVMKDIFLKKVEDMGIITPDMR